MRCVRMLLSLLALLAAAASPASATSVTVVMSGTWFDVTDSTGVTDIVNGGAFTVTVTYDDSTIDSEPDLTLGVYDVAPASSSITLSTGSFTFTLQATESINFGVTNGFQPGVDSFGFTAENFSTAGVTTGSGYIDVGVVDSTGTAHGSDALTGLPWSIDAYDSPSQGMYFLIAVEGDDPGFIELFGEFTEFAVLPEPSLLTLALVGAGALFSTRLRG